MFSILPTFLTSSEGYAVEVVNPLISVSRISGIAMIFVAGYLADRLGVRTLIGVVLAVTGVLTVMIGAFHGNAMLIVVFLQPVIITAFFPPALSAIADLGPPHIRSVAISLMIPAVNLIANGLFPTLMGSLTERGLVRGGFIGLGMAMLATLALIPLLPAHARRGEAQ